MKVYLSCHLAFLGTNAFAEDYKRLIDDSRDLLMIEIGSSALRTRSLRIKRSSKLDEKVEDFDFAYLASAPMGKI